LWEEAGVCVPLREKAREVKAQLLKEVRLSPGDVKGVLDVRLLGTLDCWTPFPMSFEFEERVEAGDLTSDDLVRLGSQQQNQAKGSSIDETDATNYQDTYLPDLLQWVTTIINLLGKYCTSLTNRMAEQVDEQLCYRGVGYVIKEEE
jgi:hypothetical protein